MISPARIAALRELLAKATPGPWKTSRDLHDDGYFYIDTQSGTLMETEASNPIETEGDNASLIVAAVNALPELLEAVEMMTAAAPTGWSDHMEINKALQAVANGNWERLKETERDRDEVVESMHKWIATAAESRRESDGLKAQLAESKAKEARLTAERDIEVRESDRWCTAWQAAQARAQRLEAAAIGLLTELYSNAPSKMLLNPNVITAVEYALATQALAQPDKADGREG